MTAPSARHAVLQSALQRVKQVARMAAERCVDSLGLSALSAAGGKSRDDYLSAQFELNRHIPDFLRAFGETLDGRVEKALRETTETPSTLGKLSWQSLSLVDDEQVEAQVLADRFSLGVLHDSEWELRELDAYMASVLRLAQPESDRNPLRPESVGLALVAGVEAVSPRAELRKVLIAELGRTLTGLMRTAYADIVGDLRDAGFQPLSLTLRSTRSTMPGPFGPSEPTSFNDSTTLPGPTSSTRGGALASEAPGPGAGRGTTFGAVDPQMMALIRRLAFLPDSGGGATGFGASQPGGIGGMSMGAGARQAPLPNLIVAHREELRQVATAPLDHMVIDVVGSLFDQILSDPKVPPQMARQIARLQLPVLRVALGDSTFFSSRRHPVRRFVNRIASLACAFDELSAGPGKAFLDLVRELVQDIVEGDFDQMQVYEGKLDALETFIAEQAQQEVREQGNPAELLREKESQLLMQQRYMQQLQVALAAVEMQDFLREFLAQVWSQVIVLSGRRDPTGELTRRMRQAARDLVMSVQPKGSPADRKAFLMTLPRLMKDLNEGMAMVGWPEDAKKAFFAQLLPAHAESLKGQSLRQLDWNLLVKQLDAILAAPLPEAGSLPPAGVLPVLDQVVPDLAFTAEEAQRIGLVSESSVDWSGEVDIDLSAEPEVTELDINLDGLPPPEAPEPTRGASLADNVQLGFAYQMHLDGQWQKVRLNYISPGHAFYVFTQGRKHQSTISLTHRMLVRLCDSGRMRAFENAYLIERATARARRQLAQLGGQATRH